MAERTRRSSRTRGSSGSGSGGKLNRDYSDEEYREPSEGYQGEEPTKGLYTCELVSVGDHTSQDDNESVKWLFRLVEGSENKNGDDVSGWMDSQYTTENSAWKEQQMLVAMGVIKPGGKVNLSYDAIVKKAKPCTVRVGVERVIDEEGEGTWRGRMNAFLPLREAGAPAKTTRRRKIEEEEPEDVDEDEPEEDEEETKPRSRRTSARSRRKTAEPEPEEDEEDEDEEAESSDYDPDELSAELEDLSLAALKKRAREEFEVKISRGMDADEIIEAILDTLDGDDEDDEEPEEEPEPPKRSRRSSGGRSTTTPSRRRSRGSSDEPPF